MQQFIRTKNNITPSLFNDKPSWFSSFLSLSLGIKAITFSELTGSLSDVLIQTTLVAGLILNIDNFYFYLLLTTAKMLNPNNYLKENNHRFFQHIKIFRNYLDRLILKLT